MKKQLLILASVLSFSSALKSQVLYNESFESATFPPTGWSIFNNGTGNDWALNDFDPAFASQGIQSMFYEYSSSDAADAWAFSPDINFANGDSIVVTFDYVVASMLYPESMKLTIGSGQNVAAQSTILWADTALVNETFATATVGVKITANGTYNFGFNCYSAADQYVLIVDNISIRKVLSNDLKMNVYTGVTRSCSFSTGEEIDIDFENIGGADEVNFPVAYRINNGAIISENVATPVTAGSTATFTFNAGADFSVPGTYNVKIFTQLAADADRSNDTISFTVLSEAGGIMVKSSLDTSFIPDNDPAGVFSALPFCGIANNLGTNIRIKRVTIQGIVHTYADDIHLSLISPVGDTLVLSEDIGDQYDNYATVTFTDTALTNIDVFDADSILPGYYHSQDPTGFAKFDGQDPNGIWQLKIWDDAGADIGYLIAWTLEFDNSVGIREHMAGKDFISVYPNPSSGLFTIESKKGGNIAGEIYAINGQLVEQFSMNASTASKQQIDLRGLAKGMYFVKATADSGVQTYKIIVE